MRVRAEGHGKREQAQIETRAPRGHAHAWKTERCGPPREEVCVRAGVRSDVAGTSVRTLPGASSSEI